MMSVKWQHVLAAAVVVGLGAYIMTPEKEVLLSKYRARRDFDKTPEPRGTVKKKKSKKPIFVIQKHGATNLHYDLRLEIDGVLKSWAIPKGPSLNPADKHLAIETEDHPSEYAQFEGVIPEGHYGAGPVMIWDEGTYENITKKDGKDISVAQAYKNGKIEFVLHGKKLQGAFVLFKVSRLGPDKWLFKKVKDEYADARKKPVSSQPKSIKTGRTLAQIKREG